MLTLFLRFAVFLHQFTEPRQQSVFATPRRVHDARAVLCIIARLKPVAAAVQIVGVVIRRALRPEALFFEERHAQIAAFMIPAGNDQIFRYVVP